jgi:ferrochelatase
MATYETVVAETERALKATGCTARLRVQPPFYADPAYVRALAERASPYLAGDYDHLLFSFHGVPERHCRKTDPTGRHCLRAARCCDIPSAAHATCYRHQAFATVRAFVETAGVPEGRYTVAFQSRFGKDVWLKPFTADELVRLAGAGVRRLLVLCPAFTADCLETLEEIGLRGQEAFLQAGGTSLTLIPCLNDHPCWVEALTGWCSEQP